MLYVTITGNLNALDTLTLKQIVYKTKNLIRNLEYCFLVESTKIENAAFLFKNAQSEGTGKTNKIGSRKWAYHKQRILPVLHLFEKFVSV